MTSIILAGGRSLRLGRSKILETIGGKPLIELVVERLAPLCSQIVIATTPEQRLPQFHHRVEIVFDIYPGRGSLGGIYSGLQAAHCSHSLVVAADMPFLNQALLTYMRDIASDFDVVVPRLAGLIEPLHAIYSRNCLAPIEAQLKNGRLNVVHFYAKVKVRYLDESELNRFDPDHLSFFNINTEAELEYARELAARWDKKRTVC